MTKSEVYKVVSIKINKLSADTSKARADRAKLRRGIGKKPGETPELFEITLADLPEAMYASSRTEFLESTYDINAIHTALSLFALHQQGQIENMNKRDISFGSAVRRLLKPDQSNLLALKRRFDSALTADELTEFAHHDRGLITLLKAEGEPLDYPKFAQDLYWFQYLNYRNRVRLSWGQDFYRSWEKELNSND
jgi:CRISPR system Cascade subunit CasB